MSVSARAHAQLSDLHLIKTHLEVPNGGNNQHPVMYIYNYEYL